MGSFCNRYDLYPTYSHQNYNMDITCSILMSQVSAWQLHSEVSHVSNLCAWAKYKPTGIISFRHFKNLLWFFEVGLVGVSKMVQYRMFTTAENQPSKLLCTSCKVHPSGPFMVVLHFEAGCLEFNSYANVQTKQHRWALLSEQANTLILYGVMNSK